MIVSNIEECNYALRRATKRLDKAFDRILSLNAEIVAVEEEGLHFVADELYTDLRKAAKKRDRLIKDVNNLAKEFVELTEDLQC